MTTSEVANELVRLCQQGKFHDAIVSLYGQDIVSVEAMAPSPDASRETHGLDAVMGKSEWWAKNHEIHSAVTEGPLVAGSRFAVVFKLDVTFKPAGNRMAMEEIAVYHVKDGKIVREEFFYGA